LLLDRRRQEQVDALAARGVGVLDLLGDDERFERALAALSGDDPCEAAAHSVERAVTDLEAAVLALDPQLSGAMEKTREQIARSLVALRSRVRGALARRDEDGRRRALALRELLRPENKLQERVVSVAHAAGVHGEGLVEALLRELDLDPSVLQLLCVDREPAPAAAVAVVAARGVAS
jgi:hypothetical protein